MPKRTKKIEESASQASGKAASRKAKTQAANSIVATFAFLYRLHKGARALIKVINPSKKR